MMTSFSNVILVPLALVVSSPFVVLSEPCGTAPLTLQDVCDGGLPSWKRVMDGCDGSGESNSLSFKPEKYRVCFDSFKAFEYQVDPGRMGAISLQCNRPHCENLPVGQKKKLCKKCASRCGQFKKIMDCDTPVDGGWSIWSGWEECPVTCGGAYQVRRRECNDPAPHHFGQYCRGTVLKKRTCGVAPCPNTPVDGGWSIWSEWEECPVTCGGAFQVRRRECNSPAPQHGGEYCRGTVLQNRTCRVAPCPIDGGWSIWPDWEECSVTCGGAYQARRRDCNNPAPQHGGENCTGTVLQNRTCGAAPCPIDGGWSIWSDWEECPVTCGDAYQVRRRECNNPAPVHGGQYCTGTVLRNRTCGAAPCPVDGRWSIWSDWTECPVTCGGGLQVRQRECNNPAPQHGGQYCAGDAKSNRKCGKDPCRAVGGYCFQNRVPSGSLGKCTSLLRWGTTKEACCAAGGEGWTAKTNGKRCENPCDAVDGGWSEWGRWGRCSVTCGEGTMTRRRTCTNPEPAYGGALCDGRGREMAVCNERPCSSPPVPVHGGWGEYGPLSECSGTCDSDTNPVYKERRRPCNNPPPQNGGEYCQGPPVMRVRCWELPGCSTGIDIQARTCNGGVGPACS